MTLKDNAIRSEYFHILWPLMVEQLFMMLIGNVNVYLFSLYSDQMVAAIGLSDQVLAIATMAMGIVSLGSTIMFLQNADEKRLSFVQGIARQTLVLNLLLGLILVIIAFLAGSSIMKLMQTPSEILLATVVYFRLVSISLVFQAISTSGSALLRSFGQVKVAMSLSIVNTLCVIAANALVVLSPLEVFGRGITGIGFASLFARAIGACLTGFCVCKILPQVWRGMGSYKASDWKIGKQILALGIPSGMENVSYNFSQALITAAIASLGLVAVSARIYTQTLTAIVFTLSVAAGQAGQVILGNLSRAGKFRAVKHFSFDISLLFMGIGMAINILIAIFGGQLLGLFTQDAEIIALGRILLWLNALYDPCRVGNEIMIASLNVLGEVAYPVTMAVIVTYLFTVPGAFLITKVLKWGLPFVWLVFIVDEGLRLALFIRRMFKENWQERTLFRREGELDG